MRIRGGEKPLSWERGPRAQRARHLGGAQLLPHHRGPGPAVAPGAVDPVAGEPLHLGAGDPHAAAPRSFGAFCFFRLFKNICCFPLLVLKGIDHYWKYFVPRGLNQMHVLFFWFYSGTPVGWFGFEPLLFLWCILLGC